jgi:hypothetical protein
VYGINAKVMLVFVFYIYSILMYGINVRNSLTLYIYFSSLYKVNAIFAFSKILKIKFLYYTYSIFIE